MMKLKDFKNEIKVLDIAALAARAKAVQIDINDLVLDKNMNKLKDLKSISKKKKELARVLTVLNQKEMIASLEPVKVEEKVEKTEKDIEKKGAKKK